MLVDASVFSDRSQDEDYSCIFQQILYTNLGIICKFLCSKVRYALPSHVSFLNLGLARITKETTQTLSLVYALKWKMAHFLSKQLLDLA